MFSRFLSFLCIAALFGFSACKSSKKPLALNEKVLSSPAGSPIWYANDNILSKGKKGIVLYSNPTLFRANSSSSTSAGAYGLRFSPTTLLEMTRFPAMDTTLDMAVVKPEAVNAPYYFVSAKGRRTLGIWQPDGYRIYLVHRFIAFKDKSGYIVEFIQLQ